jgi:hypothetical protein
MVNHLTCYILLILILVIQDLKTTFGRHNWMVNYIEVLHNSMLLLQTIFHFLCVYFLINILNEFIDMLKKCL